MALGYDTITLPTTGLVPVWLDDVMCNGTETALSACPHSMWGENDCSPNTAAGVNCSGTKYGPYQITFDCTIISILNQSLPQILME